MKCRHCNSAWEYEWEYCPECRRNFGGAVYPAKQTAQELAEIERLIALIQNAFEGVQLEDGTTIHEAELEGAYSDDRVRIAAREKDKEHNWRDVPGWKIERFHSALSFLDVKGWRFYIPAYMVWTLRNWRTTDSPTVDSLIWDFDPDFKISFLPRYASLASEQACAVCQFLQFFCDYSGEPDACKAMAAYWQQFAPTNSRDGGATPA